jgi:hypothetical protein
MRQARWLKKMIDGGYYDKAELLDMFSTHSADSSLINWKNPEVFNPYLIGAPDFKIYQGYNGTNGRVNLNFIPNIDKTLISQDNICAIVGFGKDWNGSQDDFGSSGALDVGRISIRTRHSNNLGYIRLNDNIANSFSNRNAIKYISISRNIGSEYTLCINKIPTIITANSNGLSTTELIACGFNDNGTIGGNNNDIRFVFLFSYLTDLEINDIIDITEEYLRDYHTNIINYGEYVAKGYNETLEKLSLSTYDGAGQTCHPSVINIGSVWHGYQYWMANTPFPNGNSDYENPSIWASNDGDTWVVPSGLTNPIVPKPVGSFNADTDIFYDSDTDKLYVVWKPDIGQIKIISSSDGIIWGDIKTVITTVSGEHELVSPSLIKIGNKYYIYYFTYNTVVTDNPRILRVSCDNIDGIYSNRETISLPVETGYIWWHFDITYLDGYYWISALKTLSSQNGPELYIMRSSDGINFTKSNYPTYNTYSAKSVELGLVLAYRPSLVKIGEQPYLYFGSYSEVGWFTYRLKVDLYLTNEIIPPNGNPSNLNLSVVSYNQINLLWTGGSTNDIITYIEKSTDGVTFVQVGCVDNTIEEYISVLLNPSTKYYYRVREFRNGYYSSYSNIASETTSVAPPAQNLLKWSEDLSNAVWSKVSATILTNQEYDLDGNLTLDKITTSSNNSSLIYLDGTNNINVIPGTTYRFSFDVKRGTMTNLAYSVYNKTTAGNIIATTSYYSKTSSVRTVRVSFSFVAPTGCSKVAVYLLRDSYSIGTVFVGRVQVEENTSLYTKTEGNIIL